MKASLFTSLIAIGMASTLAGSALAAPPEGKGKKGRIAIAAELISVDCTTSEALAGSVQGTIIVGSDAQSCYNYEIAITGAAAGDVYVDSVGAVWDIDGDPGFEVAGACDVTLSQPASAFNPDPEKRPEQQPEHVNVVMTGDSCTVTVFLKTAGVKNTLQPAFCEGGSVGGETDPIVCSDNGGLWHITDYTAYHPQGCDYLFADANHNGKLENALSIIDAASTAGADAIKLQTYKPDTITLRSDAEEFKIHGGLWDGRTLYELYEEAHTPWEWHEPLFEHARKLGITIFSSPFDNTAVELLEDLNVPAYKIASFEAVDLALIKYVASTRKPMIISTGMADAEEIQDAIVTARPTRILSGPRPAV